MMVRLFWILAAMFLAIAVHLAVVLYLPGLLLKRNIDLVSAKAATNEFFLVDPQLQAQLLPSATSRDIIGLCLVDVSANKVVLSAKLPNQLWSLLVYDSAGQQVYGINDIDAGAAGFTVELSKSKGLIEQLFGTTDVEEAGAIRNVGWRAQLAQSSALALLWVPVPDQNRRAELEKIVKAVTCQAMS